MTPSAIIAAHAEAAMLRAEDLTGPSQVRRIARARHNAMRALRAAGLTYEAIGALFGDRLRGSVAYALGRPYRARRLEAATWGLDLPALPPPTALA